MTLGFGCFERNLLTGHKGHKRPQLREQDENRSTRNRTSCLPAQKTPDVNDSISSLMMIENKQNKINEPSFKDLISILSLGRWFSRFVHDGVGSGLVHHRGNQFPSLLLMSGKRTAGASRSSTGSSCRATLS